MSASVLLVVATLSVSAAVDPWITPYEEGGGNRTPRYDETVAFCKRLAAASPFATYAPFGTSPQNRPLPLLIVSRTGAFTPAQAAGTHQAVVLIQAGIHAGEIDGKDAGLMLLRDLLFRNKDPEVLDSLIILLVPILNVDGHERFGPYNRINQNGPEEMGWRTTAQNLNLNRDYMKADTPEMQSLLELFHAWLPDLYVDCHVTDGIDFQYDVTYATELGPNIAPGVAQWTQNTLLPDVLPRIEAAGHRVFWYVFPREELDLSKGMGGGASSPRFSTGYAALQNRPAILIETHMLKPYPTRVSATYHVLRSLLRALAPRVSSVRSIVRHADRDVTTERNDADRYLPVKFNVSSRSTLKRFLGIRHRTERSTLSGGTRVIYTGEPYELDVPFFDDITVTDSVAVPAAYLVPPEWLFVADRLRFHGISFTRTLRPETLTVTGTTFSDVRFAARPYEGRQTATYTTRESVERKIFAEGTLVVPTNQRAAHVAIHLLEPRCGDSFVAWGFFNAVFEQKEYAEEYVMERIGREMLAGDAQMRTEFTQKVYRDSAFARDPSARLNWLYQRSAWRDRGLNVYPVGRIGSADLARLRTRQ